jgi:DNA-binding transcriptional MerR regulator
MKITRCKHVCKLLGPDLQHIVSFALRTDTRAIRELYRSQAAKFKGGHRSIRTVDPPQIVNRLVDDCPRSAHHALTVLAIWFNNHGALRTSVADLLRARGYTPMEPDLKADQLYCHQLAEADTIRREGRLFFDDSESINKDYLPHEVTLMAALLGWYPLPVDGEETPDESSLSQESTTDSPSQVTGSAPGTAGIETKLQGLSRDFCMYRSARSQLTAILQEIRSCLEKDTYSHDVSNIASEYLRIQVQFRQLMTDAEAMRVTLGGDGIPGVNLGDTMNRLWLLHLGPSIAECRALLSGLAPGSLSGVRDELDSFERSLMEKTDPEQFIDRAKEIHRIKDMLSAEKEKMSLRKRCDEFLRVENAHNLGGLFTSLRIDSLEPSDVYIFLCLFAESSIRLPGEIASPILARLAAGDFLLTPPVAQLLIEDVKLQDMLLDGKESRVFFTLLSLMVYFQGDRTRAISGLYTNENFESTTNYSCVKNAVDCITGGSEIRFYDRTTAIHTEALGRLKSLFERSRGRLSSIDQRLQVGLDASYRNFAVKRVLPRLEDLYLHVQTDKTDLVASVVAECMDRQTAERVFAEALRDEAALVPHHNHERKVRKFIEETLDDLRVVGEHRLSEISDLNRGSIERSQWTHELGSIQEQFPIVVPLTKWLIETPCDRVLGTGSAPAREQFLLSLMLRSSVVGRIAPEAVVALCNDEITRNAILRIFLEQADDQRLPGVAYNALLEADVTMAAQAIALKHGLENERCRSIREMRDAATTAQLHSLEPVELPLRAEIDTLLADERWTRISARLAKVTEARKALAQRSSEEMLLALKDAGRKALDLKRRLFDEEQGFSTVAASSIRDALTIVEKIAERKTILRLPMAQDILTEVEHLWHFRGDPLDRIRELVAGTGDEVVQGGRPGMMRLDLALQEIRECVEENNYERLGLTVAQWNQISSDRREDILDILDSWMYLEKKHTSHDIVMRDTEHRDEIEERIKTLVTRLAKVCSLYRTNEFNRIGQDPHDEWRGDGLPYIFCTRLVSPRCEALRPQIRLYVLSQPQLVNRRYLVNVQDYMSDRRYHNSSFSVFVVLGDRSIFDQMNTSSLTRHLPVLDVSALKRILFSTSQQKLPKWEFVSLLTLNSKIATIQPFKTQGSVTSDLGIFVGRQDIIKEITSSRKDYAVYGGRRIGKSSLLSELKRQLEAKGYKTVYQSVQGNTDSLSIARAILAGLHYAILGASPTQTITTLGDFDLALKDLVARDPEQDVAIFLDEVDEMIIRDRESNTGRHHMIETFRDVAQQSGHRWRFIFAGFKEMYLEIHGKGVYERLHNPWENFVEEVKQLGELESPRELISEGLQCILGLDYDADVAHLIEQYSTGHPAFLQKFCQSLVLSIDNRISPEDRRIFLDDVHRVFRAEHDFLNYVRDTIDLNLSNVQKALVYIAALEDKVRFDSAFIIRKLDEWIREICGDHALTEAEIGLELELLLITGVLKKNPKSDEYFFSHPHYVATLKQIDKVDENAVIAVLTKIVSDRETHS